MFAWAVISAWDVPNFGANPGHWRYLLTIAPMTALYAGMGLNSMFRERRSGFNYAALGLMTVLASPSSRTTPTGS